MDRSLRKYYITSIMKNEIRKEMEGEREEGMNNYVKLRKKVDWLWEFKVTKIHDSKREKRLDRQIFTVTNIHLK